MKRLNKRAGVAFAQDHFHALIQQALAASTGDDPLRQRLAEQAEAPAGDHPVWDAVLMFRPGVQWQERTPRPDWWARQVGFYGADQQGGPSGLIWRNRADQPPVETDWFVELRQAAQTMAVRRP